MIRKLLNTIIVVLQWTFSLLAAIYLIVPGYTFEKTDWSGNEYVNPYSNWDDTPLTAIYADGNRMNNAGGNPVLYLSPLDFAAPVYVLDTVAHQQMGRFFLGYSKHDIQYLIFNYRKNNPENPVILIKPSNLKKAISTAFKGVNLLELSDQKAEAYWDKLLYYGQPVYAYANAKSGYSGNFISEVNLSPAKVLKTLNEGKNLMFFSERDLNDSTISEIPVIRKLEWQQNMLHLDLSEPAEISLISSGFRLDSLTQSIHIRLIDQDWIRVKIKFPDQRITYFSNPVFRNNDIANRQQIAKADNLRSIFYNLAWLIGIILLNFGINKLRNTFIYSRN